MEKKLRPRLSGGLSGALIYGLCAALALCMAGYAYLCPPPMTDAVVTSADRLFLALVFGLLYGGALLWIALRHRPPDLMAFLFPAAALAALLGARLALMSNISIDMRAALLPWCEKLDAMSFTSALGASVGDYNVPYLYILATITHLPISPIFGIKAVSILFDVVLAFAVTECVALTGKANYFTRIGAFLLTMALPTVLVNSAWWGQCDGMFTAFCVLAIYCAVRERGWWAMALFATAFALKLQAIFILPALIGCFIIGRIKPKHLLIFPAVFAAWCVPALLCGRGLRDTLSIYLDQADGYGRITLNAPNVYQFLGRESIFNEGLFPALNGMAIMLAGCAAVLLLWIFWTHRKRLNTEQVLMLFFISAAVIPYLLPRMHERYFFPADILALVLYFWNRKRWYVPVLTVGGSFLSYIPFLFRDLTVDYRIGSVMIFAAMFFVTRELLRELKEAQEEKELPAYTNK